MTQQEKNKLFVLFKQATKGDKIQSKITPEKGHYHNMG